MNPIYRGQYPPKNTDVLWIKDNQIYIYQNGGWASVSNSIIKDAEDHLSETSEKLIKNRAVYNQYMDKDDIDDVISGFYPYSSQYLTFKILSDGNISWAAQNTSPIYYSKNGGEWTVLNINSTLVVVEGDIVRFKASNLTIPDSSNVGFRYSTCSYDVYGNIMSLVNADSFDGTSDITGISFVKLFIDNKIVNAKNLILPATTLTSECYSNMFYNNRMLKTAPELPATTLANACYIQMFKKCISLEKAPELPATTLAQNCYSGMFEDCNSLTEAPELKAATLQKYCYRYMFQNCTNLSFIKCTATNISASSCLTDWTKNVSSTGTFVKASTMNSWPSGKSGIPSGWTIQDASE